MEFNDHPANRMEVVPSNTAQAQDRRSSRKRSGFSRTVRTVLTRSLVDPPRNRRGRIRLLRFREAYHLILFPIFLIYCEVVLHLINHTGLFHNLLYPVLFGIALGLLLNIPTTLFSEKVNRIVTTVLMLLTSILYIVECLVHNAYQAYMTFSSIMTGAGGVMTGYTSDLLRAITGGFFAILLFVLPVAAYFFLGRRKFQARQYRPILSAIMLILSLVIFGISCLMASHGRMANHYSKQYEFSSATVAFGLPTALRLNLTHSEGGGNDFNYVETEALPADDDSAEEASTEEDSAAEAAAAVPTGDNVMDLDLDSVIANAENDDVVNVTNYIKSLTPSNKNEYTGLFEGKNLIVITAEAFSDAVISEELTPTLYRLQHNGFYFTDYYQPTWGGSTITGEYSHVLGLVPTNGVDSIYDTIGHNLYFTLGNQLQRAGYFNAAFHNSSYDYYERQTTHNNLGYGLWLAQGNGIEEICGKNYPTDAEMLDSTFEWYKDQQPFSVYYMTYSGHCKYERDSWQVETYLDYVKAHVTREYKDTTLYYLCYQYALEVAMTELVEDLEEAGLADSTVIELTADHYPYGLANSASWGNSEDYVADLYGIEDSTDHVWTRDHNALIIWSGCLENEDSGYACEIDDPVYSLDILPTMSNLFGLEYDSRLLPGRDVFSDTDPLVLWGSGCWITDKGKYDSSEEKFYPNDGVTVSDDYVDTINDIVSNKIYLSARVKTQDYYSLLFGKDTDISSNVKTTMNPSFEDNNPSTSQ